MSSGEVAFDVAETVTIVQMIVAPTHAVAIYGGRIAGEQDEQVDQ